MSISTVRFNLQQQNYGKQQRNIGIEEPKLAFGKVEFVQDGVTKHALETLMSRAGKGNEFAMIKAMNNTFDAIKKIGDKFKRMDLKITFTHGSKSDRDGINHTSIYMKAIDEKRGIHVEIPVDCLSSSYHDPVIRTEQCYDKSWHRDHHFEPSHTMHQFEEAVQKIDDAVFEAKNRPSKKELALQQKQDKERLEQLAKSREEEENQLRKRKADLLKDNPFREILEK